MNPSEKHVLGGWVGHSMSDTYGSDVSPDGRTAVTANSSGEVILWDFTTGEALQKFEDHEDLARKVLFLGSNDKAISIGWDGRVFTYDFRTNTAQQLDRLSGHLNGLAVSSSGEHAYVIGGERKNALHVYDLKARERIFAESDTNANNNFVGLAVSQKANLAVSAQESHLIFWNIDKCRIEQRYETIWKNGSYEYTPAFPAGGAAISPNGRHCLTAHRNQDIILWSLPDRKPIKILKGHQERIHDIQYSHDGTFALSTGQDYTVKLWRF